MRSPASIIAAARHKRRGCSLIYNVAWSDPDQRTLDHHGNIPPVGTTVDVKTAGYTNTIGAAQLTGLFRDPDFDPDQRAVYYARVLEIPTPRWSTRDAAATGIERPEDVPASLQERAWTSPIWYTP